FADQRRGREGTNTHQLSRFAPLRKFVALCRESGIRTTGSTNPRRRRTGCLSPSQRRLRISHRGTETQRKKNRRQRRAEFWERGRLIRIKFRQRLLRTNYRSN